MKQKRLLIIICVLVLMFSACSQESPEVSIEKDSELEIPAGTESAEPISVNEQGIVTWNPVEGAVSYQCNVVDMDGNTVLSMETTETWVEVPTECCLHVCPVFADGTTGDWLVSPLYFSTEEAETPVSVHFTITIDEQGMASWETVEGAVGYACDIVDGDNTCILSLETQTPTVEVPAGCCVHVSAVFADGSSSGLMISDYFGEPAILASGAEMGDAGDNALYVDVDYDVKWEELKSFDVISSIDPSTVATWQDGSLYFEALTPAGSRLRFEGKGVSWTEGSLTFAPDSQLVSLDAIGRICAVKPVIGDFGTEDSWLYYQGGYTLTESTSVESGEELFVANLGVNTLSDFAGGVVCMSYMRYQPNFLALSAGSGNSSFSLSALTVYYDETTFCTGIRDIILYNYENSSTYLEGESYDASREVYNEENFTFYLLFLPDVLSEREPYYPEQVASAAYRSEEDTVRAMTGSLKDIDSSRYIVGALRDGNGNELDKATALVSVGSTVEVTIGSYTKQVLLHVLERYAGAENLHQLTPYNNAAAQGQVLSLVIPMYWQDQPEGATEETLNRLRAILGRVLDESGNVTDWTEEQESFFSLSEYYDAASYGKYSATSFVTDWYAAPFDFAGLMEYESTQDSPNAQALMEGLYQWLMATYPNMDWSQFDVDGDGFFDSVILVNVGKPSADAVSMSSYAYALFNSPGYTGEGAGTQEQPVIKNFVSINTAFMEDSRTLIHEYGHGFGLVDYYDVTYSGIKALGGFDMQDSNVGDWNPYSKYAAGWIEPQVVTGLQAGESVELTLSAFADTGDAIVIPAADSEFDGAFGEYLLLDLFTDGGLNQYDAKEYGLSGISGVRIYHVSSDMEKRVLTGSDGKEYTIGTIHHSNSYNEEGKYLLELIQAGGKNTFTDLRQLRTTLNKSDLFQAGDVFTMDKYATFFADGCMDDGSDFGYTIEIVSIDKDAQGQTTATIRIARQ